MIVALFTLALVFALIALLALAAFVIGSLASMRPGMTPGDRDARRRAARFTAYASAVAPTALVLVIAFAIAGLAVS